ncbi:T9SS type A sorting domain-containing protein [Portibacter marinus]|uniref:T9SS type A sorting domain-containing protein n=1 Tax=Portibacter marinus TaxID=2898660 RepID=UPI001F2CCE40|nr:T9SS type A sorting domain-containing protein [Portibacter marinus]
MKTSNMFYSLIILLVVSAQCYAQSVVASAGETSTPKQLVWSWTLGESAIATTQNDHLLFTEGFQQPNIVVEEIFATTRSNAEISIQPNPTADEVTIRSKDLDMTTTTLFLYDQSGRRNMIRAEQTLTNEMKINLSNLPSGIYLLHLMDQEAQLLHTSKIIKTN